MIGMVEAQGDTNRPSIETVIDRRATLFRNNQFGSQLDNIDFLGLKKQEEDRAKEDVRRAQLRQTGVMAGASTGTLSIRTSGFTTPAEVYDMDDDDDMMSEEATRIRAEIERYLQRQQQAQQTSLSTARSDLDVAHRQSLPAGIEFHRMNTGGTDEMPPLETPTEIAEEDEEEEEFEDDEEVEIENNNDLKYWERKTLKQLEEQLELRGIQLDKKQLQEMERLKPKGKGKEMTKKQYLLNVIEGLIKSGQWNNENKIKGGKGKGSGASSSDLVPAQQSSSSTAKDILISGAKAGVETLAKAGATALAKSFLPV